MSNYISPYIDSSGLHIPIYQDILDDLIEKARLIYGQDIYLETDSADYQFLSIIALKINDVMQELQLVYDNRAPLTAVGTALDGLVKLNGLARKTASYSTVTVTITGVMGTVISNGKVLDISGNTWALPISVTIGVMGTIDVTATCETLGEITAMPGDVNSIATPTYGWIGVTNQYAAVPGQPIETDAQLRARQALSTMLTSKTMLAATKAAIALIPNVTRYNVIENYTNMQDVNGTPPHSITCVVEGGDEDAIAYAIWANRGIGCYPNGDIEKTVVDPNTNTPEVIRFSRPTYVPIYVEMTVKAFTGYTTATTTAIEEAIYTYLNSLQIGEDLTLSALYAAALEVTPNLQTPLFSIRNLQIGVSENVGTSDITISYDSVTQGLQSSPAYINITVI